MNGTTEILLPVEVLETVKTDYKYFIFALFIIAFLLIVMMFLSSDKRKLKKQLATAETTIFKTIEEENKKMMELKKQVMDVINKVNQEWVEELKTAEKDKRGVDLTTMMGHYSKHLTDLDEKFRESEERIKPVKKGWRG